MSLLIPLQDQIQWMEQRDSLNHRYPKANPYLEMEAAILESLRALRTQGSTLAQLRFTLIEIIEILATPRGPGEVYKIHERAMSALREAVHREFPFPISEDKPEALGS